MRVAFDGAMTTPDSFGGRPASPDYSSPWRNPALAVELTLREREALMTVDDWSVEVDRLLLREEGDDG